MNKITQPEPVFEIVPDELGLELSAKNSLELAFKGFFATAAEWGSKAKTITDPKVARSARLELKSLRVSAEKKRKELKEDSLRMGKAIDGANNILLALIVPIEKSLDDIEKAEERAEAARIEALREERLDALETLGHVTHGINLGTLTDEEWADYHQQAKDAFFARREREKKAKEEAEAIAKKEAEEREAQRLENIRLKAEAEQREKDLAEERRLAAEKEAAAKAEREAVEEAARKERLRLESIAETERAKAAAAAEKAAAEKAKLEAEAKALRDAEAKRIADQEAKAKAVAAEAKKAAAAPDKAKLIEFADKVRALVVPLAKSEAGQAVAAEINQKVGSFANWIETQAATL